MPCGCSSALCPWVCGGHRWFRWWWRIVRCLDGFGLGLAGFGFSAFPLRGRGAAFARSSCRPCAAAVATYRSFWHRDFLDVSPVGQQAKCARASLSGHFTLSRFEDIAARAEQGVSPSSCPGLSQISLSPLAKCSVLGSTWWHGQGASRTQSRRYGKRFFPTALRQSPAVDRRPRGELLVSPGLAARRWAACLQPLPLWAADLNLLLFGGFRLPSDFCRPPALAVNLLLLARGNRETFETFAGLRTILHSIAADHTQLLPNPCGRSLLRWASTHGLVAMTSA